MSVIVDRLRLVMLIALLAAACGPAPARPAVPTSAPISPPSSQVPEAYGRLPLVFEPNAGQSAAEVDFLARGPGYTLFLTSTAAVLALLAPDGGGSALRLELVGATPAAPPRGDDRLPGTANYFRGNDPAKWQAGLPTYRQVTYPSVWPGIDLVYYGRDGQLEYDFVVAPGASPDQVRQRVAGATSLEVDGEGALLLHTTAGTVRQAAPVVYQDDAVGRQPVSGAYILEGDEIRFAVGPYDPTLPLVIDPVLVYGTYLGGDNLDGGGIAVDGAGQVYIAGLTLSANFPTTAGAFDTGANGNADVFVAKLNPNVAGAASLVYSTYLGGSDTESVTGIAVDGAGQVYIAGTTPSGDFPTTPGALDTTLGGTLDAFVAKLNPNATGAASLVYSTYLGGGDTEDGGNLAVDGTGQVYVTGRTSSAGFPTTPGAFDSILGGMTDAFVVKLNPNATGAASLVYGTFLGGGDFDVGFGLTVDGTGQVYVTGQTASGDFPTTAGAFDTTRGGTADAFVAKLNPNVVGAAALVYSTYLGGGNNNEGTVGLAVDGAGQIYVTGQTDSGDFPTTPGAFDTTLGGTFDGFVTKLNPNATGAASLVYSTYLGGGGSDVVTDLVVDGGGQVYVIGVTMSGDFPITPDALDTSLGGTQDGFVAKLNLNATGAAALVYSSYLGGGGASDAAAVMAIDASGIVYVSGTTDSGDFPTTPDAFDTSANGNSDAFVVKLDLRLAPTVTASGGSASYVENAVPVAIDPGLTVADGDSVNLIGATVSITGAFQASQDVLAFTNQGGITGVYNAATGVLTLSGTATVAAYESALRTVTYANTSDGPDLTIRTVTFQVTDHTNVSGTAARTVTITPVNDPPVNTVPAGQGMTSNTPRVFSAANGNAITIADPDTIGADIQAVLNVPAGQGTLAPGAAGTAPPLTSVTGSGTATLTLVGNLAEINAALDGLTYTPPNGFTGQVTLTITTSDLGNTPAPALQDQDAVQITVTVQPTVSINDPAAVNEGDTGTPNTILFTVTLSAPSNLQVQVPYTVANGTATGGAACAAGIDFLNTGGTVTFAPLDTSETIVLPVCGDALVEANETVLVNLGAPTNATLADNQGVGTIANDDASGTVSFSASTADVPESAGSVTITVQRTGGATPAGAAQPTGTAAGASVPSGSVVSGGSVRPNPPAGPGSSAPGTVGASALGTVTVSFATSDVEATAGLDYVASAGSLTFGVGETTKTIVIPILADSLQEGPEHFTIVLSGPTGGASLGQAVITVTIIDTTHGAPTPPGDDSADAEREERERDTEEERRQRARTNQGNKDDDSIEGDVIEVRCDQPWPSVVIANRDGAVEVKLIKEAQAACSSISVGDYLEADGEKQHESLFHADSVEIKRRR